MDKNDRIGTVRGGEPCVHPFRARAGVLGALIGLLLLAPAGAWAARSFGKVAGEIDGKYKTAVKEEASAQREIERKRADLTQKLAALQLELTTATEQLALEQAALEELSRQRDELKKEISTRLANKDELDTLVTDHARNFLALAEKSPYSAETPGRLETLKAFISGDRIFGMDDLKTLITYYFDDMTASEQKVRYAGKFLDRGGNEVTGEIVRLGHIAALHRTGGTTGYLMMSPASGRLLAGAEPPRRVRSALNDYLDGKSDDAFIDISGGVAIQQLARRVTLADQMRSGGPLVIPILLVGLVALILTIERLIFLGRVRHNTDALMTRVTEQVEQGDFDGALKTARPHQKRPTGRVLMAGLLHRGQSREVIESALSEAILKQAPRLEHFLGALKVSAAVAPLLGLLGTVTGMINTFQVITTHGTGDPRLMAGGISEAMVTTQVGLAVAIPVMMVAAFLSRRAYLLSQDMEEKGLALLGAMLKSDQNGSV